MKYAYIEKIKDINGFPITQIWVNNGIIRFSVILERGFDIGEIYLRDEKISWERDVKHLLNSKSVDLKREGGWEKGFYCAVTSLGPQLFGTPDEIRTVHGTVAYSAFDEDSLKISEDEQGITVSASCFVKGFEEECDYKKTVTIYTRINSEVILRKEDILNISEEILPIDDGYHIQLGGNYIKDGGKLVLPVPNEELLLRDSAPVESDPTRIYPFAEKLEPIRCYQYVPRKVVGLEKIEDVNSYIDIVDNKANLTCEMWIDDNENCAAVIMRPLDDFPRSLIAKRNLDNDEPMYAIEPCKTRPNSIQQKAIDGELQYIAPGQKKASLLAIFVTKKKTPIQKIKSFIEDAKNRY